MLSDAINVLCLCLQDFRAGLAEKELEQLTMAVSIIRKDEEALQEPPEDTGVATEGVEVLNKLTSVASACALLLGLIYCMPVPLLTPKPCGSPLNFCKKSSCSLSNTRCPLKYETFMADFKAHSKETIQCIVPLGQEIA